MDDNRLAPKASENDELSAVRVDRQTTDGGQFPLGCDELVRLMDFTTTPTDKVIGVLASWGGVEGVCKKLNVDPNHGLNDNELDDPHNARKEKYGENMMPPLILPTLLEHALAAVKDVTLLCLLGAATISLAFGLYSDFTNEESEPNVHWVEGFAIFLAVFIIVVITAANNYKKDGLLRDQAAESDNIRTPVRRNGDSTDIPVHNILVGDIVLLKDGDIIPVDGLVIDSQSGKCDESSATGESDPIKKRRFDADSDCKLVGNNGKISAPKTKGEDSEKRTDTAGEGSNTKKATGPNPATGHVAIDIEDGPIDFSPSPKKGKSSSVPFLVQSGTKVNEGTLTVVALAVGVHSRYGQLLKEVKKEVEDTPLQKLLAQLAASIGWFGLGAALAQLVILTIKLVVKGVQGGWQNDIRWGPEGDTGSSGIVFAIINIIIQAVTIIVVAVPEGLPMAVTIALIYGTRKMAKRNNFVRQLAACETMGGATTICTDKTGTLTENRMTVVAGRIAQYVFERTESAQVTAALTDPRKNLSSSQGAVENRLPPPSCLNLFRCAIVRNTKAFVTKDENGVPVFRGDKTESALLKLCITDMTSVDLKSERTRIERIFPFSSKRKSMTSIARSDDCAMNPEEKFHMYVKGAAEVILSSCSQYMDSAGTIQSFQNANDSFEDMAKKKEVYQLLDYYAKQSLRCIVIAYLPLTEKEYQKMQTEWEKVAADGEEPQANYGNNLVFLGIVGIEDPLRNGVDVAVRRVQNAGIVVRMVTGDNIVTATSIAMKAGILANGGICMEGTDFRQMFEEHNAFHARLAARNIENDDEQMPMSPAGAATRRDNAYTSSNVTTHLPNSQEGKTHKKANVSGWIDKIMKNDISPDEDEEEVGRGSQSRYSVEKGKMSAFDKMLPKLRVLARSSPKDKQILVEHLKSLGETVAVTGDGANDGPALKAADVGFAMGIAGSGIAKEAASIILLDDNFCSVVTAVVWGRSISDSVRKFLMFQLTVNVTAVTVAVISSIVDDASSSVLTAVQLLWVNLLMDTFGALALATDEPDEEEYLSRPPMNNKRDPLITWNMRCMIIGQAIWQIVVTLTLLYAGHKLFLLEVDNEHGRLVVRTIVFNAFVLCNIFNEVNCRRIDRVFNIFRKLHTNLIFIAIIIGTFICQFFIVHFGGDAFKTTPIGGGHWAACIFIGLLTWPLGLFIRIVFFRVSARAKAVKVDVYPTINPSWKRELLWKRAYRMALRQSRMSSNTNLGLSAQANEEETNTMTITLPIPVYNRLRNALENNTGSAENVALGSQGQLEESRSSNPGGLAPARSLNFPIFESVVAGIAARKAENST